MASVQIVRTWRLFGGLHLMNRVFTNPFLSGQMSQVIKISLLIAALLATDLMEEKIVFGWMCQVLLEALRMLREHMPDSCLSLLVIHRLIRNLSVLISVVVSSVLLTNIALGVIVLTEKRPAFFFLTQREGTMEIVKSYYCLGNLDMIKISDGSPVLLVII